MFFLQTDRSRLRTVCDTFAHCVAPVLSGSHESFRPSKSTADDIVDILLTPGSGASDELLIQGMDRAIELSFEFAPKRAMKRLEELILKGSSNMRAAACGYLRMYNHSSGESIEATYIGYVSGLQKLIGIQS